MQTTCDHCGSVIDTALEPCIRRNGYIFCMPCIDEVPLVSVPRAKTPSPRRPYATPPRSDAPFLRR
jgi:hypothetical protein